MVRVDQEDELLFNRGATRPTRVKPPCFSLGSRKPRRVTSSTGSQSAQTPQSGKMRVSESSLLIHCSTGSSLSRRAAVAGRDRRCVTTVHLAPDTISSPCRLSPRCFLPGHLMVRTRRSASTCSRSDRPLARPLLVAYAGLVFVGRGHKEYEKRSPRCFVQSPSLLLGPEPERGASKERGGRGSACRSTIDDSFCVPFLPALCPPHPAVHLLLR